MSQPYGESAGYYGGQQQQQPYDPKYAQQYNNGYQNNGYQPPHPPPQQQFAYDGGNGYNDSNGYGYNAPPQGYDPEKYTFEEAFKVEKPKWNDLWAAILVSWDVVTSSPFAFALRLRPLLSLTDRL